MEADSVENEYKQQGNLAFKSGDYQAALTAFTAGIRVSSPESKPALLHNRALTHFRLQNWSACIEDCTQAMELDPNYSKAIYRRAAAYIALRRFNDAIADYRHVIQLRPTDKVAVGKLRTAQLAADHDAFLRVLTTQSKPLYDTLDLVSMAEEAPRSDPAPPGWVWTRIESQYEGSRTDLQFGRAMPHELLPQLVRWFSTTGSVIDQFTAYSLLFAAQVMLDTLPNVVDVRVPPGEQICIIGDVHGQYFDFLHALREGGFGPVLDGTGDAPGHHVIVLGDMVDRGSWGTEIVLTLCALKLLLPERVHMIRGNHESAEQNMIFGFQTEVTTRYTDQMFQAFSEFFRSLPLGIRVNTRVLCIHGGLFSDPNATLGDMASINRQQACRLEPSPLADILWSDPDDSSLCATRKPSPRGLGTSFGYVVARDWMESQGLTHIFRGHMQMQNGFTLHWPEQSRQDGRYFFTVFSAADYCGCGNRGGVAIVLIDDDGGVSDVSFNTWPAIKAPIPRDSYIELSPVAALM